MESLLELLPQFGAYGVSLAILVLWLRRSLAQITKWENLWIQERQAHLHLLEHRIQEQEVTIAVLKNVSDDIKKDGKS